jgi:hypothetical protein
MSEKDGDRGRARADLEFAKEVLDMRAHRAWANRQVIGDLGS